jgi:hypothetical protein
MVAVAERGKRAIQADGPEAVKERLEAFGAEVLAEAANRPVQRANGGLYLRRWSRSWAGRRTTRAFRTSSR